jgi:hypothetical protein
MWGGEYCITVAMVIDWIKKRFNKPRESVTLQPYSFPRKRKYNDEPNGQAGQGW